MFVSELKNRIVSISFLEILNKKVPIIHHIKLMAFYASNSQLACAKFSYLNIFQCLNYFILCSLNYIALNDVGTAIFNPRPAVVKFLELKGQKKRMKLPDEEIYQNQELTKMFFSIDSFKGIV